MVYCDASFIFVICAGHLHDDKPDKPETVLQPRHVQSQLPGDGAPQSITPAGSQPHQLCQGSRELDQRSPQLHPAQPQLS